jgi:hypothetical protein
MEQITNSRVSDLVELSIEQLECVAGGLPKGTWEASLPKGTWESSLPKGTWESSLPKGTWDS